MMVTTVGTSHVRFTDMMVFLNFECKQTMYQDPVHLLGKKYGFNRNTTTHFLTICWHSPSPFQLYIFYVSGIFWICFTSRTLKYHHVATLGRNNVMTNGNKYEKHFITESASPCVIVNCFRQILKTDAHL